MKNWEGDVGTRAQTLAAYPLLRCRVFMGGCNATALQCAVSHATTSHGGSRVWEWRNVGDGSPHPQHDPGQNIGRGAGEEVTQTMIICTHT